jgi:hypothetical protein
MYTRQLTRILALAIFSILLVTACRLTGNQAAVKEPPLADTLRQVFADMTQALASGDSDNFFELIHPDDRAQLRDISKRHGYSSLKAYLEGQMRGWPDPDTLAFADLITTGQYARLALWGAGTSYGPGRDLVRYTFLLFKQYKHQWRLSAMSSIEKEREDPYGYKVTYHETDLPSKLRFPRAW